MKVLHYSDSAVKNFLDLYSRCDILISTGDLSQYDFFGLEDIPLEKRKPSFGVYGNHDSGLYLEHLGITNLHNKIFNYKTMVLGGFQGCLKYKDGNSIMYTEEEAQAFANNFPQVDILLLHAGPAGILDEPSDTVHQGSPAIRRYVSEKPPKYVFLGHQYSNGDLIWQDTKYFRSFGARLIEIE